MAEGTYDERGTPLITAGVYLNPTHGSRTVTMKVSTGNASTILAEDTALSLGWQKPDEEPATFQTTMGMTKGWEAQADITLNHGMSGRSTASITVRVIPQEDWPGEEGAVMGRDLLQGHRAVFNAKKGILSINPA